DYVGGWKIADRGDRWIRSEAGSWFMTAHIVVQVDDGQLSVATFVRYDRPIAALVWPPLSAGHRLAMPGLLRKTDGAMRIAVEGWPGGGVRSGRCRQGSADPWEHRNDAERSSSRRSPG